MDLQDFHKDASFKEDIYLHKCRGPCGKEIVIGNKDILSLGPQKKATKKMVDFWLSVIFNEKLSEQDKQNSIIFDSSFYSQFLKEHKGRKMERAGKEEMNIFEKKFLFIPIFFEGCQWMLAIINFRGKTYPITGPYGIKRPCILFFELEALGSMESVSRAIREYLKEEHERVYDRHRIFNTKTLPALSANLSLELNDLDDAIIMLHCIESFFEKPVLPLQLDFSNCRFDVCNWFSASCGKDKRLQIYDHVKEKIISENPQNKSKLAQIAWPCDKDSHTEACQQKTKNEQVPVSEQPTLTTPRKRSIEKQHISDKKLKSEHMFIYRDMCGHDYADMINLQLSKRGAPYSILPFFDMKKITHFVAFEHANLGILKSKLLYVAMCKNILILRPTWLDSLLECSTKSVGYIFDKIVTPAGKGVNRETLFQNLKFVFMSEFPMAFHRFTEKDLAEILDAAGGTVEFTSMQEIEAKIKAKQLENFMETFIITNCVNYQQSLCDELLKRLKWVTIHPDYFLEWIWKGKSESIEIENFLITTKIENIK